MIATLNIFKFLLFLSCNLNHINGLYLNNEVSVDISFYGKTHCGSSYSTFYSQFNSSLTVCLVQCGIRQRCEAVNFKRHRGNLCEILLDRKTETTFKPGCLHITRDRMAFSARLNNSCGCNMTEVCDLSDSSCSIKECDPVKTMNNGVVFGDIYSIGSRILITCDGGYTLANNNSLIVCQEDGRWSVDPICRPMSTTVSRISSSTSINPGTSSTKTTSNITPATPTSTSLSTSTSLTTTTARSSFSNPTLTTSTSSTTTTARSSSKSPTLTTSTSLTTSTTRSSSKSPTLSTSSSLTTSTTRSSSINPALTTHSLSTSTTARSFSTTPTLSSPTSSTTTTARSSSLSSSQQQTSTTQTPIAQCLDNWYKLGSACFFFGVSEYDMDFYDAESYCNSFGGNLASIVSQEEDLFIYNKIQELTNMYGYHSYWLGLKHISGDEWRWNDGNPVNYTNWGPLQPNGYVGDCLFLYKYEDWGWYDYSCYWELLFVCKADAYLEN